MNVLFVCSRNRLRSPTAERVFAKLLAGTRVVCLDIPDNYEFMQPELVALLERRMVPYLR